MNKRRQKSSARKTEKAGTTNIRKSRVINPRLLCIRTLADVLDEGKSLAESSSLKSEDDPRNLSQARHLAYGVLRWQIALAWLESRLVSKPLKHKDRDISRLLWLGMFQLWQDRTPDHAAIYETTECARSLGKSWAVGMINAVLRRFQREQAEWLEKLSAVPEHWAHPAWLIDDIRSNWPDHWERILDANNQAPPLWIRVNETLVSLISVREKLEDAGFECTTSEFAPQALLVSPAAAVSDLPGFDSGHFSVQDAAAQLTADLLEAGPGMRILDACAAPGGKTGHLLERYPGVLLTAVDRYPNRLERIEENLKRLKLKCELICADATETGKWWNGKAFDRILLDAPCSALGVLRRHPEIRHLREADQMLEATELQQQLLQALWPLLAPGGMLVYATCSFLLHENAGQIAQFLVSNADAEEVRIRANWGHESSHGRQILPGEHEMDGFYYAVLRKRS